MTNDEKLKVLKKWLNNMDYSFIDIFSSTTVGLGLQIHIEEGCIYISSSSLEVLTIEELKGMIGHELGHLFLPNCNDEDIYAQFGRYGDVSSYQKEMEHRCDLYMCKFVSYATAATGLSKSTMGDEGAIKGGGTHPSLEDRLRRLYKERYYAIE